MYALGLPLLIVGSTVANHAPDVEMLTPTGRYAPLYWGLHSHLGLLVVGPVLVVFGGFWATVTAWFLAAPIFALIHWGKN